MECDAICSFKNNGNIVSEEADNGGMAVVMQKQNIQEAEREWSNIAFYVYKEPQMPYFIFIIVTEIDMSKHALETVKHGKVENRAEWTYSIGWTDVDATQIGIRWQHSQVNVLSEVDVFESKVTSFQESDIGLQPDSASLTFDF